jgi:arginase family enzyme
MTVVLGVPACPGSPDSGEHAEPSRLRREGLLRELGRRGVAAGDVGDVPGLPPPLRPARAPGAMRTAPAVVVQAMRVREAVSAALEEHEGPLVVLGGDCSLALGALPGAQVALGTDVGLVWLGRYANANVPATTPSGDLAGMAVALLCGEGDRAVVTALGAPLVDTAAVRLVARDFDPGEREVLERVGLRPTDLHALEPPPGPLYVAIECGLFEAPYGPQRESVQAALRGLAERRRVAVVALTGTTPERVSAAGVAALVAAALGRG